MADPPKRRPAGSEPTAVPFRIRPAIPRDATPIVLLERRCFSDPWSRESFHEAITSAWTVGLVAEDNDSLLGYLIGREVAGSAEVLNLAVAPEARRRGVGRALLQAGLRALAARGAEEIFLEVRESNHAAQALYAAAGFRPVGRRPGYYRSPTENALVFRLPLAGGA